MHRATEDWDAPTYDAVADPQERWGAEVVGWLKLSGDETVLDAGCGTGRVTARLLARLPRGRVVAVDSSPGMLAEAARRLAAAADRVRLVQADLAGPPLVHEPVAAVLSTATLHWIDDHDAVFRNLAAVLRPGGQLAAQCGGAGNLARVRAAVAALGIPPAAKRYETAGTTASRLADAGFVAVRTWLTPAPTPLEPAALERFLRTVVLRVELTDVPAERRAATVRAVATGLPGGVLDYVRLNIVARRGAG